MIPTVLSKRPGRGSLRHVVRGASFLPTVRGTDPSMTTASRQPSGIQYRPYEEASRRRHHRARYIVLTFARVNAFISQDALMCPRTRGYTQPVTTHVGTIYIAPPSTNTEHLTGWKVGTSAPRLTMGAARAPNFVRHMIIFRIPLVISALHLYFLRSCNVDSGSHSRSSLSPVYYLCSFVLIAKVLQVHLP